MNAVLNFVLGISKEQPWAVSLVPMALGYLLLRASPPRGSRTSTYVYLGVSTLIVCLTYAYSILQPMKDEERVQIRFKEAEQAAQEDEKRLKEQLETERADADDREKKLRARLAGTVTERLPGYISSFHSDAVGILGYLSIKWTDEAVKKTPSVAEAIKQAAGRAYRICATTADELEADRKGSLHAECEDGKRDLVAKAP